MSSDLPPVTGVLNVTQEADTLQATGVVGLGREADRDRDRYTVAEQIALGDADLRRRVEVVSAAMTIEEVETWVAGAQAAQFAVNVLYHKEKEYSHFTSVWLFGAQAMLDQIKRNRER